MVHLIATVRRILVSTWPSALVAVAAWISIVVCLDPAGSYPSMPQGPGLTVDEIFNVEQGWYLVDRTRAWGWYNLVPGMSIDDFRPRNNYNPDHPPLGRYWLGVHHQLTWWIAPPHQPAGPFVTACARTGSATAFALTVWLIGAFVTIVSSSAPTDSILLSGGRKPPGSSELLRSVASEEPGGLRPPLRRIDFKHWAGPLASLALVLMPRVYGHAHLAALETITNLTCTAAVLAIAAWWTGPVPTRRAAIVAGVVMGLALLTKIQAILIPVPVIAWALYRWRQRAVLPLLLWGATAFTLFFAAWPYLWLDPVGHMLEYLGRTTSRATLHCFYFGTRYADKAVPWHYPFVMFAVTVPVGLHVLGVLGWWRKGEETADDSCVWRNRLILACALFPLIVFALPGVAVYDGERLFLTIFPLWAIFIGRGAARAMEITARQSGVRMAKFAICALILLQFSSNLLVHPFYLSYYNLAVGGMSGADKLGLEMNYWGDAITRSLLKEAIVEQPGGFTSVEILPSLHQFQNGDLIRQSPILRQRMMIPSFDSPAGSLRLAFRRRADLSDEEFLKYHRGKGGPGVLAAYDFRR